MLKAVVVADMARFGLEAERLGGVLSCPVYSVQDAPTARFQIAVSSVLSVIMTVGSKSFTVCPDFNDSKLQQRKQAGSKDLLVRACGLHKADHRVRSVLDTTAGFGADALVLAAAGVQVKAFERDRLIYELLVSAQQQVPSHSPEATLEFFHGDPAAQEMAVPADIVYMDPMFSGGMRKALSTKNMMFLQEWLCDEYAIEDQSDTFHWALEQARQRVVVKRSKKAGFLDKIKPTFQIMGKTHRFDVYQRG